MATETGNQVTVEFLSAFAEAWSRHDLGALMSFMAEDCMFQLSVGPDIDGTRYEGREQVRAAFAAVLEAFPDGHWGDDSHFVCGDRGVSEWTFTATGKDGKRTEVRGCDVFTFHEGKIAVKNSFRKARTS